MNIDDFRLAEDESEKAFINEWRVDFREPMPPSEVRAAIANLATDKAIEKMIEDIEYHGEGCCHVGKLASWKEAQYIILPMDFLLALKDMVKK